MEQTDYIKVIKISAGAGIAIALAQGLGLNYSASAGIITLLSIQDTKKETIRVMALRLCSFGVALMLSAVCFYFLGYGVASVSVFLLFFSGISIRLRMQEGISVNTVLMTHFLAEQSLSPQTVANELAILVIGAGIGVLLNLYIPGKGKQIRTKQRQIEGQMRGILGKMADMLTQPGETSLEGIRDNLAELGDMLRQGEKNAFEEMQNKWFSEAKYYLSYMNMRRLQSGILEQIAENIGHLTAPSPQFAGYLAAQSLQLGQSLGHKVPLPPQSEKIARFMRQISSRFHEHNNAVELLREMGALMEDMRAQPLPDTREEFEGRAVLYRILLELEQFLVMKKAFVDGLPMEDIKKYWDT